MPPVRLITDSTADLDPAYRDQHHVVTVPLKVIFGDEEFIDGVTLDVTAFYARMRSSTVHPRTSQPTPAEFEAAFREAAEGGATVICTTMSAEMSGTYSSAILARQAVPELDVHVLDTRSVTFGHGLLARAAVDRIEAGADAAAVLATLRQIMGRQRILFSVPSLEYLRRGGRIGGARAFLGSVLNIKPVLHLEDGKVEAYDRVRTWPRALDRIAGELATAVEREGRLATVVVAHGDCLEEGQKLATRIAPCCVTPPEISIVGPIVGCHSGPGVVGLAYSFLPDNQPAAATGT